MPLNEVANSYNKGSWDKLLGLYIAFMTCDIKLLHIACDKAEYIYLFIICLTVPFVFVFREDKHFYVRYLPITMYLLDYWMILTKDYKFENMSGITGSLMDWERLAFATASLIYAIYVYELDGVLHNDAIKRAMLFLVIFGLTGIVKSGYLFVYKGLQIRPLDKDVVCEWVLYVVFTAAFYTFNAFILTLNGRSET